MMMLMMMLMMMMMMLGFMASRTVRGEGTVSKAAESGHGPPHENQHTSHHIFLTTLRPCALGTSKRTPITSIISQVHGLTYKHPRNGRFVQPDQLGFGYLPQHLLITSPPCLITTSPPGHFTIFACHRGRKTVPT